MALMAMKESGIQTVIAVGKKGECRVALKRGSRRGLTTGLSGRRRRPRMTSGPHF